MYCPDEDFYIFSGQLCLIPVLIPVCLIQHKSINLAQLCYFIANCSFLFKNNYTNAEFSISVPSILNLDI